MTRTLWTHSLPWLICVSTFGLPVHAQSQVGSLLVFPEYDQSSGTLLTVTNTGAFAAGSLETHWLYVDRTSCVPAEPLVEPLTPNDTISVLSSAHFSGSGSGYVYVYAADATTHQPIAFNHLIGASMRFDGTTSTQYAIEPVVFRAMTAEGTATDLDQDGVRDLDGLEYDRCPDKISIPRFLGQSASVGSDLVLIDMTGGLAAITAAHILAFNDQRFALSATKTFHCWDKSPLGSIAGVFSNTFLQGLTNAPNELIGDPAQETGWMEVRGGDAASVDGVTVTEDAPVLAFLIDRIQGGAVAGIPFGVGAQAGGLPSPVAPPNCPSGTSLSLWPPNHKYFAIDLNVAAGVTDSNGQPISIVITSITQDEPVNGQGDGNTVCDGTGVGTSVARIRAERQGGGNGRVYKVNYTATNSAGLSCSNALTVTVPHDQSGAPAVDDGQTVDSSTGCP